jgi:hypothetical protein
VADAESAAGECVERRAVGAAVVGDDALDLDAAAAVERDRPLQKRDRGRCFLVLEDFGVREAAVVVDADVDVLPADGLASLAARVGACRDVMAAMTVAPALAGAALDPAQLLDPGRPG